MTKRERAHISRCMSRQESEELHHVQVSFYSVLLVTGRFNRPPHSFFGIPVSRAMSRTVVSAKVTRKVTCGTAITLAGMEVT